MSTISKEPTPYRLLCYWASGCGSAHYLTEEEYDVQLDNNAVAFKCPECGGPAIFDDSNYDKWMEEKK
jgi:hypothetical protein